MTQKQKYLVFVTLLLSLMMGCSNMNSEKIEFVKKGITNNLLTIRGCETKDGYLKSSGEFSIKSKKVLTGEDFEAKIRMSIGDEEGHIILTIGDNTIAFSNEFGIENEKGLLLIGPSIGKTISLGKLNKFVAANQQFELSVIYQNGLLTYQIDGKNIFSEKAVTKPAGKIQINEYHEDFRIYDLFINGQFQTSEELYSREYLLDRAQKSIDKAAEGVKDDPNRPAYHFQPPANWNNDPNGMLFYNGYYHMFYQHNPYADVWDWMHWGHARSKDLVHWEHLPIALWPSVERGEDHCFSGSGYIMDNGNPILFYTSIGHEDPEHWAAIPTDDELINWKKHPTNPIIVMSDHGDQHIDDWRDPFLFRENGETYMVIGGHPSGQKGSITMYEALNPELTEWRYLGLPFSGQEGNWECPNFFKVGDKYVLIYSPHGQVEYYVGDLDIENVKFVPLAQGAIDNGASWNYYAPNTLQKDDGRRILFGWIPGFKDGQGWQGAISLPRELSINEEGRLIQTPVEELTKLRGKLSQKSNIPLENMPFRIPVNNLQFEINLDLGKKGAKNVAFRFADESGKAFEVDLRPTLFKMGDQESQIEPGLGQRINNIRIFFDRTILEIFVNNGAACATKVIYPDRDNFNIEIFSDDQNAVIEEFKMWDMKAIW
jgi:beta-fructofuranosidase